MARQKGAVDRDVDLHLIEALFTTVTNVDFDPTTLTAVAQKTVQMRDRAEAALREGQRRPLPGGYPRGRRHLDAAGRLPSSAVAAGTQTRRQRPQHRPRRQLGAEHPALRLQGDGRLRRPLPHPRAKTTAIYGFLHKALAATLDKSKGLMDFVQLAMECGKTNIDCMGLLNEAHKEHYQPPTPTQVSIGTRPARRSSSPATT